MVGPEAPKSSSMPTKRVTQNSVTDRKAAFPSPPGDLSESASVLAENADSRPSPALPTRPWSRGPHRPDLPGTSHVKNHPTQRSAAGRALRTQWPGATAGGCRLPVREGREFGHRVVLTPGRTIRRLVRDGRVHSQDGALEEPLAGRLCSLPRGPLPAAWVYSQQGSWLSPEPAIQRGDKGKTMMHLMAKKCHASISSVWPRSAPPMHKGVNTRTWGH